MKLLFHSRFRAPVYYCRQCESTMDEARLLATEGAKSGVVVVAGRQRAGRGQHDRVWHAQSGRALLCSLLLRSSMIRMDHTQSIPLRVACAIHRVVWRRLGIAARIRWPNDILVQGRKVCGVLSEFRDGVMIIGIGLNCTQRRFPSGYATEPTSLYLCGGVPATARRTTARRPTSRRPTSRRARLTTRGISPRVLLAPLVAALYDELAHDSDWNGYMNTHLWRAGKSIMVYPASSEALLPAPFSAHLIGVAEDGALRYARTGEDESRAGEDNSRAGEDNSRAGKDKSRAGEDKSRADEDDARLYAGSIRANG